jgi:hypothetical protein
MELPLLVQPGIAVSHPSRFDHTPALADIASDAPIGQRIIKQGLLEVAWHTCPSRAELYRHNEVYFPFVFIIQYAFGKRKSFLLEGVTGKDTSIEGFKCSSVKKLKGSLTAKLSLPFASALSSDEPSEPLRTPLDPSNPRTLEPIQWGTNLETTQEANILPEGNLEAGEKKRQRQR